MKKRLLYMLLAVVTAVTVLSGCDGIGGTAKTTSEVTPVPVPAADKEQPAGAQGTTETAQTVVQPEADFDSEVTELDTSKPLTGKHHVRIEIEAIGSILVELDADSAPITVTNFVKLAQEDFYDGLTFHRIIDGFMMQGGDPMKNGTGGSKENIKGEFKSNGVENNLSHARGAISMARSQKKDSASSQFFIVQTDSRYLDGDYAVFGYVLEGMDIVDAICKAAKPIDKASGLIAEDEQPVIEDIIILD